MSYLNPQAIVSTEWLSRNINDPNLVVLDGTYHLPTANRNASEEFPQKHIEGAVFFDIDDIADANDSLPHMLPSDEVFSEKVGALGIDNEKRVVVYDVYGMQSAARTWWMFRFFGHENVAVLDGGLPKWIKEGNQISSSPVTPLTTTFVCNRQPQLVKNLNEIKEGLTYDDVLLTPAFSEVLPGRKYIRTIAGLNFEFSIHAAFILRHQNDGNLEM